jgi:hypothetical protein
LAAVGSESSVLGLAAVGSESSVLGFVGFGTESSVLGLAAVGSESSVLGLAAVGSESSVLGFVGFGTESSVLGLAAVATESSARTQRIQCQAELSRALSVGCVGVFDYTKNVKIKMPAAANRGHVSRRLVNDLAFVLFCTFVSCHIPRTSGDGAGCIFRQMSLYLHFGVSRFQ